MCTTASSRSLILIFRNICFQLRPLDFLQATFWQAPLKEISTCVLQFKDNNCIQCYLLGSVTQCRIFPCIYLSGCILQFKDNTCKWALWIHLSYALLNIFSVPSFDVLSSAHIGTQSIFSGPSFGVGASVE